MVGTVLLVGYLVGFVISLRVALFFAKREYHKEPAAHDAVAAYLLVGLAALLAVIWPFVAAGSLITLGLYPFARWVQR